jgi:RHS repeat-associated protein
VDGGLVAEYQANAVPSSPQKEYGYRNGQLLITATGNAATMNDLALGKTATQSSTFSNFPASLAVDGNANGNFNGAHTSSAADYSLRPWWQVDLGTVQQIGNVQLSPRTDCCPEMLANVYVFVSDVPFTSTDLNTTLSQSGVSSYYVAGNTSTPSSVAVNRTGRYLRVQRTDTQYLVLAEVQVWSGSSSSQSTVKWLVADHLGTPRMIVDQTGSLAGVKRHDYLPFGEELQAGTGGRTLGQGYSQSDGVRQKFTQKERDNETGLDYFGARYYASTQGRFTSADDFLNDTHVDTPASWNLYVYVRNNPLRYIDPAGQEIYSTNLSVEQRMKLIEDWEKKTGYKNVYFDSNNKLVIDTNAGFQGGSAKARDQLSAAVNSSDRFNLEAVNTTKVAFASVDRGTDISTVSGQKIRTDYTVSLDFNDFKNAGGDDLAKEAFSVGIAAIHEFDHKLYNISDSPSGPADPGPLERTFINPIRQELGLSERVFYTSRPVDAAFKTSYTGGGQQLNFKLNGENKVIRWRNDLVGGKVKD